jgi:hypothetical protein
MGWLIYSTYDYSDKMECLQPDCAWTGDFSSPSCFIFLLLLVVREEVAELEVALLEEQ